MLSDVFGLVSSATITGNDCHRVSTDAYKERINLPGADEPDPA